jgi:hypothetical protein
MSQSPGLLRMGAEWVPVGAWGGRVVVSTMAGKRLRRWPRVSPLPRDPLRPTQTTSSRGRGRGWGNIELLSRRWDARVCAIDNATPHPPFGHLVSFKRGPRQLPPRGAGFVGGGRIGEGTSRLDRLWALAPVLACRVGFGQRSQTANCGCRSSVKDQAACQAACRAGGRKVLPRAGQTRPASIQGQRAKMRSLGNM